MNTVPNDGGKQDNVITMPRRPGGWFDFKSRIIPQALLDLARKQAQDVKVAKEELSKTRELIAACVKAGIPIEPGPRRIESDSIERASGTGGRSSRYERMRIR